MLIFPSFTTAREPTGMNRSQDGHMRPHFMQKNNSSTSLEGMERPVRSFKSFIKTTPPHPMETEKALPQTPAPWKTTHSGEDPIPSPPLASPPLASIDKNAGATSWRRPADWYNDSAIGKPAQPLTPFSMAVPRTFSPLIPDPSFCPTGMTNPEPSSCLTLTSPPPSRLLPIYERTNGKLELGPPGSPPKSPLPATPPLNQSIESILPVEHRRTNSSQGPGSKKGGDVDPRVRALSPANPEKPILRSASNASTKEKAYIALGINSPRNNKSYLSSRSSTPEAQRADRQYLRGKKLRALYKGSPLADDSWEDEEMDDKTLELSFSQDYHDLLADQYQEMNVRAEEVLSSGGAHQVYEARFDGPKEIGSNKDQDLIPRALSWQKGSGHSTPRSQSREKETEQSSNAEKRPRHRRLSAWVPHRLSVAPIATSPTDPSNEESLKKERRHSKSKQIPDHEADKELSEDLRFSKFFPASKPIKFGKKHKNTASANKSPPAPSFALPATPLMRLLGGLAVIRTHSPSPAPKSEVLSDKSPTSVHTRGSSNDGSEYVRTTSNHCSSFHSPTSQSPAIPIRSAFRTSGGSYHSHHSSSSPPLAQEMTPIAPPPPPPPPPVPSSSPTSPPLSPDAWSRFKSLNKSGDHRYKPGFIEKAKETRRRRNNKARQDRLKKSIKVLGPTDPGVVSGYVRSEGRLPGYMVSSGTG